jgi:Pentapeptide repeats (8 copies)
MTKSPLLMLLLLAFTPSFAVNPPKFCFLFFVPSKDKAKWTWMDRDCHIRTRADLDRILDNHHAWIKEYLDIVMLRTHGPLRDNLRADLSGADLEFADLTGVYLHGADLTGARLSGAVLTGADLDYADLAGAILKDADLTGADLDYADLTGAILDDADLTGAILKDADLSSADLEGTDLSGADLTRAALWYADFEPKALPPVSSIARADGLQTLRWSHSFDELDYHLQLKKAREHSYIDMPELPSLPQRSLLWLSRYRERLEGKTNGWRDDLGFLWSDIVYGLQTNRTGKEAHRTEHDEHSTVAQGKYPLLDLRNALNKAGYSEAELQVNLAYQRHTQSTLGMILYDWTCDYGAAPSRPLIFALALALFAIPIYWLGFRHRLFGAQLLMVEKPAEKEVVTDLGDPHTRPNWRTALEIKDLSTQTRLQKLLTRLRLERPVGWLRGFIASVWPRLRWEAGFFKAVVLFSLISIINLGFGGLDFGRWVRLLFFREYELKARGWLRMVSGLQSLVGLGLLALSLLSFFGHPFE